MGNQPSAPPPSAPPPPPPPAPPIPEECDMDCQRNKRLADLKTALNLATENKDTDPEAYERARIAYNTQLQGQGWLVGEKQRIAKQEVEPVLTKYNSQYGSLKAQQQTQGVFKTLEDALTAQVGADKQSNMFLKKQQMMERDAALRLDRLNQLGAPAGPLTNWLGIGIDFVITILALVLLFLIFTKMSVIMSLFSGTKDEILPGSSG